MKLRLFTLASLTILAIPAFAQDEDMLEAVSETRVETNPLGQTVITSLPATFRITPPAREWEVIDDEIPTEERKEVRNDFERDGYLEALTAEEADGARQTEYGRNGVMRQPIVNFNGLTGSGVPPDPSGAAGPDHYVQAVNTSYRVYDKSGNAVAGPFSLSSLWSGSSNMGDPIVMYDRHADRWFISQFQFAPNRILVAISETGDPTGSYYEYSFTLSQFPDYPKYSIWWDGYYMTSNSQHTAVVFERDKMLQGDPTAQMVSLSLPSLGNGGFRSPLSADADGDLPPNGTPCYFFNLEDNAFSGVSQDQIEIYEMTTDWTTTSNSSVSSSQQLSVPAFDAVFTGGFANISQPGTAQRLDVIQGVLMFRAQHMRWVGYNTIMLSHAVDMGSNRSAIRWYELRDADDGVWTLHQSGTFDPDNSSRWMSSIAMNSEGHIGMGYSFCNANTNTFPGLAYTGRFSWDAPGDMSFFEQVAIAGSGSQTFSDRYGDYGHLSLDPDGETFWYTGEYLGAGGSPRTRIFSFNLSDELGIEDPYYDKLELKAYHNGTALQVNAEGIFNNEDITIDLIGIDGKVIYTANQTPVGKAIQHQINTSALASGIYFVRIGNKNFQKAERLVLNK